MKTTVKALQDLYVKLGGQLTDTYSGIADGIAVGLYKRIPDIIEAVKEKASGGGGGAGLPEVTAADNGDVLTVVEGAWAKASASGALIVGINYDGEESLGTLDKTWQEIYDAVASGRGAVILDEWESDNQTIVRETFSVISMSGGGIEYSVYSAAGLGGQRGRWLTSSADGYPTKQ